MSNIFKFNISMLLLESKSGHAFLIIGFKKCYCQRRIEISPDFVSCAYYSWHLMVLYLILMTLFDSLLIFYELGIIIIILELLYS